MMRLAMPTPCVAFPTATNKWEVVIDNSSDGAPAVGSDGTIYFGSSDGKLWAIRANGATNWIFRTECEIWSSPALGSDGTVYFGCRNRKFYAVRPNGKKKWEFKTGGWVDSSPALAADGTIYFGSWDKDFYALNPSGSLKWRFHTAGPIVSSPAIDAAGRIYFGSHDHFFYALDPDGTKAWAFAAGAPVISSPAIDADGCLFFTSVNGFFYALNRDGSLRWRLHTGSITQSSPVIGQDGLLYVGVNEWLWAISPDGKKKWDRLDWGRGPIESPPLALADGTVCSVSRYGMLTDLDEKRPEIWIFYLYGNGCASPAVGTDGTIYIRGKWRNFSALQTGVPLAQSPWPKFRADLANTGRQPTSHR